MTWNKKTLSDTELKRVKPPKTGRLEIGDTIVPGLVIRVTPKGKRSFSVIYKVPGEGGLSKHGRLLTGRQHRITIGQYPMISLKRAREEAREIIEVVSEGHDPRVERRERNLLRLTDSVEAVSKRFINQDAKRNIASWKKIESTFRLHIIPKWGDRPISDIRRADIHELLDDIVTTGRVGTAREVRKHLSRLFNWAVDREIISDNPVHGMERKDLVQNGEAGRALTDEELRILWIATGELGYPFGDMYRMLLLTGQRRNEWANALRSEINTQRRVLEIPASRYKGKRDHVVPLTDPVWAIFEALPVFIGNDYHLFSSTIGKVPVSGFSKAKARLDEIMEQHMQEKDPDAALVGWRVHDMRVTCETRLADLGLNREIRDAVLGHAKPGLQRNYNKHDYFEEKHTALKAYAEHILKVVV